MKKLKKRWNIDNNWQIIKILIVFTITGSISLLLAIPFLNLIGIPETFEPHWLYRVLRILLIFPIYQIMLVIIGAVFGEFKFFWEFEKKMLNRLKLHALVNFIDSKLK
jgi:sterol desaturase/sphingolipid hydroxylase (fatty acid hydroxylase superfamily)